MAAILAADVVGCSQLMGEDEAGLADDQRLVLGIGISLGDVIVESEIRGG